MNRITTLLLSILIILSCNNTSIKEDKVTRNSESTLDTIEPENYKELELDTPKIEFLQETFSAVSSVGQDSSWLTIYFKQQTDTIYLFYVFISGDETNEYLNTPLDPEIDYAGKFHIDEFKRSKTKIKLKNYRFDAPPNDPYEFYDLELKFMPKQNYIDWKILNKNVDLLQKEVKLYPDS